MAKYIVTAHVTLQHEVEANSQQEAIEKADQNGDLYADYIWKQKKNGEIWTVKKVKE